MEVYHATNSKFEKFDNRFLNSRDKGYFGEGFYFVDELQHAWDIQRQLDARYLLTCEVTDNLYDLDLEDDAAAIENFPAPEEVKAQMREIAEYNGTFFRSGSGEGFGLEKHLKAAGYAGVRVLNRLASVGLTNYVEVVVFDAKDIEITEIEDEESED